MISKINQWVALVVTVAGSLLLMLGNTDLIATAYMLFIIGNVAWIKVGYDTKLKPLIITNVIFLVIDLIALYNWS